MRSTGGMRGVAIGILLGFALGWLLFAERSDSQKRADRAPAATPASTPTTNEHPAPTAEVPAPPPAPLPKNARGYVYTQTVGGTRRFSIDGVPIEPRPLEQVLAAMERARAEKNWPEFLRGVVQLGMLDTPVADAHLVSILADEALELKGVWTGAQFYEALKDSKVDGIAEAARLRAEIEFEKTPKTAKAGLGYLSLVALFGEGPGHAWLESLTTDGAGIVRADRAFAEGSANAVAAERMRRRYLDDGIQPAAEWVMFARENPAVAFDTAAEMIRRSPTSVDAFRLLGQSTTEETLGRAREILGSLPDDAARLMGIRAVQVMAMRKLDVGGFEELLATPRVVLEAVLSERSTAVQGRAAIATMIYCPLARTEANMAALRRVVEHGNAAIAQTAKEAVAQIERSNALAGGWEPQRK